MVQYEYDEYGQKTVMTYPDGTQARYAYDEMSRLVSVTAPDGTATRYEYDLLGRRTRTTDGTLTTAYRYDKNGNLTEQKNNEITLTYQYDKTNRMTEETRTENGKTLRSSYGYDAAGQLASRLRGSAGTRFGRKMSSVTLDSLSRKLKKFPAFLYPCFILGRAIPLFRARSTNALSGREGAILCMLSQMTEAPGGFFFCAQL